MLKDRDYDVTPYIIAHILRQIRKGSANSARWGGDGRRTVRVGVDIGKEMVSANSAGWGGDREGDGVGEQCGLGGDREYGGGEQCGLGWR